MNAQYRAQAAMLSATNGVLRILNKLAATATDATAESGSGSTPAAIVRAPRAHEERHRIAAAG